MLNIDNETRKTYLAKLMEVFINPKVPLLEKYIYDFSRDYIKHGNYNPEYLENVYKDKIDELYYCLNMDNTKLYYDFLQKKVTLDEMPYLKPHEYYKDALEPILKKKENIEYKKNNFKHTTAYTCRSCKNNKCEVYELQTRSADEPATKIITCINCKNRWYIFG